MDGIVFGLIGMIIGVISAIIVEIFKKFNDKM